MVAKALKFVGWFPNAAGTDVEAPRHEIAGASAGALLHQAEAPLAADLSTLDGLSVLENEVGVAHASTFAHVLDKAGAFDKLRVCVVRQLGGSSQGHLGHCPRCG